MAEAPRTTEPSLLARSKAFGESLVDRIPGVHRVLSELVRVEVFDRSIVIADPERHTYDWQLRNAAGKALFTVRDVPFRETGVDQLSEICVGSSTASAGLRFDSVELTTE